MPVDPRLAPMLRPGAALNFNVGLPLAELRELDRDQTALRTFVNDGPDVATVIDRRVPVDGGEIILRVYKPYGESPFPAHLYIHGGGFFLGTIDHADATCRWICEGAGCVVGSVGYRLAPESTFPVPAEDCYTALRWMADHAVELDVDAARLSVGGVSAGGNLSAVVALMARDRSGPNLSLQVLELPVCDLTLSQPSMDEYAEGYFLTKALMERAARYYLPDVSDAANPYVSPLFANDLAGLPPALVMTAEYDPLRDEGEAFARRLHQAAVPTTLRRWMGQIHGSLLFDKLLPVEAKEYRETVNAALRRAYGERAVADQPSGECSTDLATMPSGETQLYMDLTASPSRPQRPRSA